MVIAQLLGLQQLVEVRLHQSLHDVAGEVHESRQMTKSLTASV